MSTNCFEETVTVHCHSSKLLNFADVMVTMVINNLDERENIKCFSNEFTESSGWVKTQQFIRAWDLVNSELSRLFLLAFLCFLGS
jgi:hypothetical protein